VKVEPEKVTKLGNAPVVTVVVAPSGSFTAGIVYVFENPATRV
jgi:hypothetical protein